MSLSVVGRLAGASNAAFLAEHTSEDGVVRRVVYKPVAGERPLWDFPDGHLAFREVAAHLLSEVLGWSIVPDTWYEEGPHGPGMVQEWVDVDESRELVRIVTKGAVPEGFVTAFDGVDHLERPVELVHADSAVLRRMAIFDVLANNADRKGGHVLPTVDGRIHGIDHGVAFHSQPKLRTVLWGWAGEPLHEDELAAIDRAVQEIVEHREGSPAAELAHYLSIQDLEAVVRRGQRLLRDGVFPAADTNWPSIPWPPF